MLHITSCNALSVIIRVVFLYGAYDQLPENEEDEWVVIESEMEQDASGKGSHLVTGMPSLTSLALPVLIA